MLMLADIFEKLLQMPTPVFLVGGVIAVVAIVAGTMTKIVVGRSKERTKRDIAAYVAEGTIDPDKAIQMLKAGEASDDDD